MRSMGRARGRGRTCCSNPQGHSWSPEQARTMFTLWRRSSTARLRIRRATQAMAHGWQFTRQGPIRVVANPVLQTVMPMLIGNPPRRTFDPKTGQTKGPRVPLRTLAVGQQYYHPVFGMFSIWEVIAKTAGGVEAQNIESGKRESMSGGMRVRIRTAPNPAATPEILNQVKRVAAELQTAVNEYYRVHLPGSFAQGAVDQVSIKDRAKYIAIDIGSSGAYLVDKTDGMVYGIKAYGVPHHGRRYGAIQQIDGQSPAFSRYGFASDAVKADARLASLAASVRRTKSETEFAHFFELLQQMGEASPTERDEWRRKLHMPASNPREHCSIHESIEECQASPDACRWAGCDGCDMSRDNSRYYADTKSFLCSECRRKFLAEMQWDDTEGAWVPRKNPLTRDEAKRIDHVAEQFLVDGAIASFHGVESTVEQVGGPVARALSAELDDRQDSPRGHYEVRHYLTKTKFDTVADPDAPGLKTRFSTRGEAQRVYDKIGASRAQRYFVVRIDARGQALMNPAAAVAVNDRVMFSRAFLRSTGQYAGQEAPTSTGPFARGRVRSIQDFGASRLAEVKWDDGRTTKVLAPNLVREGAHEVENPSGNGHAGHLRRSVARWEARGGKRWIELFHDGGGYSYREENGGGNLGPLESDQVAIARIEQMIESYRRADFPSIRRVNPRMTLLTKADRAALPALYSQEALGDEAIARVKFFTPWTNWTWYATEFDGEDIFFGLVRGHEVELGNFSLSELQGIRGPGGLGIERDLHFRPTTIGKLRTQPNPRQSHRNPPRTRKGAEAVLDRQVEQAWYRNAHGVQVSVLDIPKIFRDIKLELAAGTDIDAATKMAIQRYEVGRDRDAAPNPPAYFVIDPTTRVILKISRASTSMDAAYRSALAFAENAAARLRHDLVVVVNPYIPSGFKVGQKVSPLFYHYGATTVKATGGVAPRPNPLSLKEVGEIDKWARDIWIKAARAGDVGARGVVDGMASVAETFGPARGSRRAKVDRMMRSLKTRARTNPTEAAWGKKLERTCVGKREPCGVCPICKAAAYNLRITGLAPLDRPGTEEYFAAVRAEQQRKLGASSKVPAQKSEGPRIALRRRRTSGGFVFPQTCDKCGVHLVESMEAWASRDGAYVVCDACYAKGEPKKQERFTRVTVAAANPIRVAGKDQGAFKLGAIARGKLKKDGQDSIRTPRMTVLVNMVDGYPARLKWGSFAWGALPSWDRAFQLGYTGGVTSETMPKLLPNPALEISLESSKLVNTPGVLSWVKAGYQGSTPSEKAKLVNILVQGYKLPGAVARGLLDGSIAYTVRGEKVVFQARFPKGWKPNPPSLAAQRFISRKIRQLRHEGRPSKQSQAIAYSKARRAGYRVPKRAAAANPPSSSPWKHGQKIPVATYRAWLVKNGTPQQVKDFDRAMALQSKANRPAKFVLWKTNLEIPGMSGRVTLVHYGDTDEHTYKPPAGSKKGASWYRHEWEGRKVPILVDPTGKTIITPLAKGQSATDWMRG